MKFQAFWRSTMRTFPRRMCRRPRGSDLQRPLRTILDLIDEGKVERRFIRQALKQALNRGLITHHQIRDRHLTGEARKMFDEVIRQAA